MYIDMQTNKGTGQRIRKEKPNRAKMGWGVLTPTSQEGTSEVSNCPQSHTGLTNPFSTPSSGYCWVGWSTAGSISTAWHGSALHPMAWEDPGPVASVYLPWLKVARHLYVTQENNFHPFRQCLQGLSKSHINAKRMKQTRIECQGLWKLSGHWNYGLRR